MEGRNGKRIVQQEVARLCIAQFLYFLFYRILIFIIKDIYYQSDNLWHKFIRSIP